MELIVVGINHKKAPLNIREKVSFTKTQQENAYKILRDTHTIKEVVLLSTCNRSEITAIVTDERLGIAALIKFFYQFFKIGEGVLDDYFLIQNSDDAVKHIFKLAAGLDSLIIGEDQILGQVRQAHESALQGKNAGRILNKLYREAITTAKKIKRETSISQNPLSISSIAVKFIEQTYHRIENKRVLVIGVGKMSRIAIENLLHRGVKEIFVTNRTKGHAVDLSKRYAEIGVIDFHDRYKIIPQVDILISSTGAPHFVVKYEEFIKYHIQGEQLCIVDLAVPRDVEARIGDIVGIDLYDCDDLKKVSSENMESRWESAKYATEIIIEDCIRFENWYHTLSVVPVIEGLKRQCEEILEEEVNSLLSRLENLSFKDKELIELVMASLVKKIIRKPILNLKNAGEDRQGELFGRITCELFGINSCSCGDEEV